MKFLLINSNPDNAFVALSDGNKLTVSSANDYMTDSEKQKIIKSPDKLIQCFENIALSVYRPVHDSTSRRTRGEGSSTEQNGDLKDIDAISVTTGPGSFTGIRVGLAVAKGAAASLEKKIIPIDNFELTLNRIKDPHSDITYCVLLPAKLPEYYYAVYRMGKLAEMGFLQKSELASKFDKNTLLVGNFSDDSEKKDSYFTVLKKNQLKSEIESMVELSEKKFGSGSVYNPEDVKPVYIKDFVLKSPADKT